MEGENGNFSIRIGQRCQIGTNTDFVRRGEVKYVGEVEGHPGVWVGISLDEPVGRNDGSAKGKVYFKTAPKHGIFAKPENVQIGDFPVEKNNTSPRSRRRIADKFYSSKTPPLRIKSKPRTSSVDSKRTPKKPIAFGSSSRFGGPGSIYRKATTDSIGLRHGDLDANGASIKSRREGKITVDMRSQFGHGTWKGGVSMSGRRNSKVFQGSSLGEMSEFANAGKGFTWGATGHFVNGIYVPKNNDEIGIKHGDLGGGGVFWGKCGCCGIKVERCECLPDRRQWQWRPLASLSPRSRGRVKKFPTWSKIRGKRGPLKGEGTPKRVAKGPGGINPAKAAKARAAARQAAAAAAREKARAKAEAERKRREEQNRRQQEEDRKRREKEARERAKKRMMDMLREAMATSKGSLKERLKIIKTALQEARKLYPNEELTEQKVLVDAYTCLDKLAKALPVALAKAYGSKDGTDEVIGHIEECEAALQNHQEAGFIFDLNQKKEVADALKCVKEIDQLEQKLTKASVDRESKSLSSLLSQAQAVNGKPLTRDVVRSAKDTLECLRLEEKGSSALESGDVSEMKAVLIHLNSNIQTKPYIHQQKHHKLEDIVSSLENKLSAAEKVDQMTAEVRDALNSGDLKAKHKGYVTILENVIDKASRLKDESPPDLSNLYKLAEALQDAQNALKIAKEEEERQRREALDILKTAMQSSEKSIKDRLRAIHAALEAARPVFPSDDLPEQKILLDVYTCLEKLSKALPIDLAKSYSSSEAGEEVKKHVEDCEDHLAKHKSAGLVLDLRQKSEVSLALRVTSGLAGLEKDLTGAVESRDEKALTSYISEAKSVHGKPFRRAILKSAKDTLECLGLERKGSSALESGDVSEMKAVLIHLNSNIQTKPYIHQQKHHKLEGIITDLEKKIAATGKVEAMVELLRETIEEAGPPGEGIDTKSKAQERIETLQKVIDKASRLKDESPPDLSNLSELSAGLADAEAALADAKEEERRLREEEERKKRVAMEALADGMKTSKKSLKDRLHIIKRALEVARPVFPEEDLPEQKVLKEVLSQFNTLSTALPSNLAKAYLSKEGSNEIMRHVQECSSQLEKHKAAGLVVNLNQKSEVSNAMKVSEMLNKLDNDLSNGVESRDSKALTKLVAEAKSVQGKPFRRAILKSAKDTLECLALEKKGSSALESGDVSEMKAVLIHLNSNIQTKPYIHQQKHHKLEGIIKDLEHKISAIKKVDEAITRVTEIIEMNTTDSNNDGDESAKESRLATRITQLKKVIRSVTSVVEEAKPFSLSNTHVLQTVLQDANGALADAEEEYQRVIEDRRMREEEERQRKELEQKKKREEEERLRRIEEEKRRQEEEERRRKAEIERKRLEEIAIKEAEEAAKKAEEDRINALWAKVKKSTKTKRDIRRDGPNVLISTVTKTILDPERRVEEVVVVTTTTTENKGKKTIVTETRTTTTQFVYPPEEALIPSRRKSSIRRQDIFGSRPASRGGGSRPVSRGSKPGSRPVSRGGSKPGSRPVSRGSKPGSRPVSRGSNQARARPVSRGGPSTRATRANSARRSSKTEVTLSKQVISKDSRRGSVGNILDTKWKPESPKDWSRNPIKKPSSRSGTLKKKKKTVDKRNLKGHEKWKPKGPRFGTASRFDGPGSYF
ncbi:hypothetical protein AAMO2058_001203400 [Amorphochlora amoebiformis]